MLITKMTMNESFLPRTDKHFKGFGICHVPRSGIGRSDTFIFLGKTNLGNGGLGNPFAGIDPLPTIFRQVSGKESITRMRQLPDKMVKNQKINLQPKWASIAGMSIGPKLGAVFVLPIDN